MARPNKPRETPRNLTKTYVEALQPVPGRRAARVWDATLKGFGVSVTAAGVKSYFLNYRVDGIERRYTLGRFPDLTVAEAREQALLLKARVAKGEDPLEDRRERRRKRLSEPTVRDLCERAMAEHFALKSPETRRAAEWQVRTVIVPALGPRPVARVAWGDVAELHREVGRTRPYVANRVVALLSKVFELAARWGWRERNSQNPARGHARFKEAQRGRSLSAAELARLGAALAVDHEPAAVAALRLILLTGARPQEWMGARWADIDFAVKVLHLEKAKTGPRKVILPVAALDLLGALSAEGADPTRPVLADPTGKPLRPSTLRTTWERVAKRAEIPKGTRPYDATRHTYGSWAAELGVAQEVRMELMGHRGKGSHSRYIHREKSLHAAADLVAGQLAAALRGEEGPSAKVLPMRA